MGCDIHMFAEKKVNGKWEKIGDVFKNPYYNKANEKTDWNREFTCSPFSQRNYDLFSILADVRNGYGFAGIKTGEGFNPISEPKGLPADVSEEVKIESDGWDCDGHSHSFFTVKELKDFDWNQITIKRGVIGLQYYKVLKENEQKPTGWSGAISGPNIITIDEDVADRVINGEEIQELKGKEVYVNYHWSIKYADHVKFFLNETIPSLEELGDTADVRIVFWFDN